MALMENWDFFQENLETAYSSEGTLERQAEIYEESWEASSKRVKAALESIYEKFIDDEVFIDILDTFEDLINYSDNLIDTVGGLKGVLITLGAVLTKVFSKQMAQGITNMAYNLRMMTASGQKAVQD